MIMHFSVKEQFVFQNKGGLGVRVDFSGDSHTNEAEPGAPNHPTPGQFKISMNAV